MYEFRKLSIEDIESIIPEYMLYFNTVEEASWNKETARRRLRQLILKEDVIGFLLIEEKVAKGFAIGQLIQFDDGLVFELSEILIYKNYQHQGLGTVLVKKMEEEAKKQGAFRIQLTAFDDELRHNFYNKKLAYVDATNNKFKTKEL